jgi:hypothetical protein
MKPHFNLSISGEVKKFVTIEPRYVKIEGPAGRQLKRSVTIIPEENYPFKIIEANAVRGKEIRCNLNEIKKPTGAEYLLIVENLKQQKGRFFDTICLKTDSRIRPEIRISVYGNIYEIKPKG